ncbi:hypothetical protein A0H76_574 [Hepatospora eriocheir]|uniref:Uncharacterized protein n=1 Tax=Hepatospora eriocheir TaxID=1081669 RepID=A0A1X0QIJ4_9MICR|nr:hypothetical protein A0H76_574 [Hepatospora eriocheir]
MIFEIKLFIKFLKTAVCREDSSIECYELTDPRPSTYTHYQTYIDEHSKHKIVKKDSQKGKLKKQKSKKQIIPHKKPVDNFYYRENERSFVDSSDFCLKRNSSFPTSSSSVKIKTKPVYKEPVHKNNSIGRQTRSSGCLKRSFFNFDEDSKNSSVTDGNCFTTNKISPGKNNNDSIIDMDQYIRRKVFYRHCIIQYVIDVLLVTGFLILLIFIIKYYLINLK